MWTNLKIHCPRCDRIFLVGLVGIQCSSQMLTFDLVRILQICPCQKVSSPTTILFLVKEDPLFGPAFIRLPSRKYYEPRTLAHSVSGFDNILQLCLASTAKLKECRSLKPIPPNFLGIHIHHQLSKPMHPFLLFGITPPELNHCIINLLE
jgi:hypothetical protein